MQETQTSLTGEQKWAILLLSAGTFLEYFDLMLYVHMAVLLNELFFPKTDPFTASLISAFAFCSTYVLRPIGALIFGWIGDNWGRKYSVVITTSLMSASCLTMAMLPTYEQIGITAAWCVTICRIVQGMSSMGELVGAQIYLTEFIKPPFQYPAVELTTIASRVGSSAALAIAAFAMPTNFGWRVAFFIGAVIAVIGAVARRTLRETPVFADAKRRTENNIKKMSDNEDYKKTAIWNEKPRIKTLLSNFALVSTWPIWFYTIYMYSSNLLKNRFHYSAEQVINHNLPVSIACMIVTIG
jgi:MFS family permease